MTSVIRMLVCLLLFSFISLTTSALQCQSLVVVETIPDGITFSPSSVTTSSTTSALTHLIDMTTKSLDIAQFYFTLRSEQSPGDGSDADGRNLWDSLLNKGLALKKSGGLLRIVHNVPDKEYPDVDTKEFVDRGAASVKYLDFKKLIGGGIIHTKLWISDNKHFYLGSANTDWRSLRQVKELGILGINCPAIGEDLQKMFDIYWYLTSNPVPASFPPLLDTQFNTNNPMKLNIEEDGSDMDIFLVSSPPQFCSESRTVGIDGLLQVLNSANEFIYIEVMEYFPAIIYSDPNRYWPIIDDALRRAVFDRGVELRFLAGLMPHNVTRQDEYNYLASLAALDGSGSQGEVRCSVKLFIIPEYTPEQEKIPYARVNHAKFVVTEKHSYVSTSNWSGDYFTSTAGISAVMKCAAPVPPQSGVCQTLLSVFERDWNSEYIKPLTPWGKSGDNMTF